MIIAHRLLKNSIAAREYILLTESAKRDLRLDLPLLQESTEGVEDIGPIRVTAYRPSFSS